jgi:hypothetical protein
LHIAYSCLYAAEAAIREATSYNYAGTRR